MLPWRRCYIDRLFLDRFVVETRCLEICLSTASTSADDGKRIAIRRMTVFFAISSHQSFQRPYCPTQERFTHLLYIINRHNLTIDCTVFGFSNCIHHNRLAQVCLAMVYGQSFHHRQAHNQNDLCCMLPDFDAASHAVTDLLNAANHWPY